MGKIRMGILGCSEFAGRAMIPNMEKSKKCRLLSVASRSPEKAKLFASRFLCESHPSYEELLDDDRIQAVYMPLPAALHEEWVSKALEVGKHVLVEKPFATNLESAEKMLRMARERGLLIIENILFPLHPQTMEVIKLLKSGIIGDLRLFRGVFTIPELSPGNIRYSRELGGGSLRDLGIYLIKASRIFLGEEASLVSAYSSYGKFPVDISGAGTFGDGRGRISQIYFGFNHAYANSWELTGTQGRIIVDKAFTPKPDFVPAIVVETRKGREDILLDKFNFYSAMWDYFADEIEKASTYAKHYDELLAQTVHLENFIKMAT